MLFGGSTIDALTKYWNTQADVLLRQTDCPDTNTNRVGRNTDSLDTLMECRNTKIGGPERKSK